MASFCLNQALNANAACRPFGTGSFLLRRPGTNVQGYWRRVPSGLISPKSLRSRRVDRRCSGSLLLPQHQRQAVLGIADDHDLGVLAVGEFFGGLNAFPG